MLYDLLNVVQLKILASVLFLAHEERLILFFVVDIGVPTVSMIGNVNGLQEPLRYSTPL